VVARKQNRHQVAGGGENLLPGIGPAWGGLWEEMESMAIKGGDEVESDHDCMELTLRWLEGRGKVWRGTLANCRILLE